METDLPFPGAAFVRFYSETERERHLAAHPEHVFIALRVAWLRAHKGQVAGMLIPFTTEGEATLFRANLLRLSVSNMRSYSRSCANAVYARKADERRALAQAKMEKDYAVQTREQIENPHPSPGPTGSLRHLLNKDHPLYRPEATPPARPTLPSGEFLNKNDTPDQAQNDGSGFI